LVFEQSACLQCQIEFRFPREFGRVDFCSAHCRIALSPPKTGAELKGIRSRQNKRRRKKYECGDKIDPYVVYVHYDWVCQLCKVDIDPELRLPDHMAATLDHVTPLSAGGTHTWDNVVPAHAICNFKKAHSLDLNS
jgi:5-methylcytosine-specific restriction endonuclease McrA